MILQSIRTAARGHNTTLAFEAPITILAGPTGAGKTTVLNCVQMALTGAITADGKTRSKPGDVFDLLSATGEPVSAELDFGSAAPSIERVIAIDPKGACSQALITAGVKASKVSDVEKMIAERIGDLARVDVAGLIGKDPAKRRAEILQACRASATPVTMPEIKEAFGRAVAEAVKAAGDALEKLITSEASPEKIDEAREFAEAASPDFDFQVDATKGLIGSAEARRDAAKEALAAATAEIKRCQQAIDTYVAQANEQSEAGDIEAIKARIAELDAEISKVAEDIGAASGAQGTRDGIQRRLNELVEAGTVEDAQAAVEKATADFAAAKAARSALPPKIVGEWSPAPGLTSLREQAAAQRQVVNDMGSKVASGKAVLARLDASLRAVGQGGCCPTCSRPMDESARGAVQAEVDKATAELRTAEANRDDEAETLECIEADLQTAQAQDDANRHKARDGVAALFDSHRDADLRMTAAATAMAEAEKRLARAQTAVKEREDMRRRADAIPVTDVTLLQTQRSAAEAQRADLKVRADAIAADEARQQMYRQSVVRRDDLQKQIPTLKLAVKAYTAVADYVGQRAVEPLVSAVDAALPEGWTFELNVADASFAIRRGEVLTQWAGLSGGERAMALAALAGGMAGVGGNKWRAVLIDGAEAIAGAGWRTEYEGGLFGAFVEGLARAVKAGKIDQAIITTNRPPVGAEAEAIQRAGAVVRWMGELAEAQPVLTLRPGRVPIIQADPAGSPVEDEPAFLGEPEFMGPPEYLEEPVRPSVLDVEPPVSRGGAEPRDMDAERGAVRLRLNQAGISAEAMEYLMVQFTDRKDRPVSSATLKRVVLEGALAQLERGRTAAQVIRQIGLAVEAHPVARKSKAEDASA